MKAANSLSGRVAFWALLAVVLGLGVLLYRIVEPFFIPLFFAAMLAMLCRPQFEWVVKHVGGRRRAAAGMTAVLLLVVLFPLGWALFFAGREIAALGETVMTVDLREQPEIKRGIEYLEARLSPEDWQQVQASVRRGIHDITSDIFERTQAFLENVIRFVVGLAVMGLALYYFFSDGPQILRRLRSVSPFEDKDEEVVFEKFASICRGVILGTIFCALMQSLLMGIGLLILGISGIWLLTGLTFLCSMIPLIGAATVWVPLTIWLALTGEYSSAVFMAIYGTAVVSLSDNLVRAYVLHESAGMHPLLAIISVIGALQLVGMWGVFLGPLIAALFYTLLKLLNTRLQAEDEALTPVATGIPARDAIASPNPVGKTTRQGMA
jgi:predicted PurR-regulated permease PerM